jgi:hypothetical protein
LALKKNPREQKDHEGRPMVPLRDQRKWYSYVVIDAALLGRLLLIWLERAYHREMNMVS